MSVDIEAIRRRVRELNGEERRKSSNLQLWKPAPGKHRVRGIPWKDAPPESPLKELYFYYLGDGPGIVSLHQFGQPDPINEMCRKLYSTRRPEDRAIAKKLQPKMRAYLPVIVRGEEDKGVQIWSLGKILYQRILGFWLDEEINADILDPEKGFDLIVNITQVPGKDYPDTTVDAARSSSPLHSDPSVAKKWLDTQPNLEDIARRKTYAEIEKHLNDWLNGGPTSPDVESPGTARGDLEDKTAEDLKEVASVTPDVTTKPAPVEASKPKRPVPAKKAVDLDDVDVKPAVKKNLDDAFAELLDP